MKKQLSLSILMVLAAWGCSSMPGRSESDQSISSTGPTVSNVRTEPGTFDLNQELKPIQTPQVIADVKDFNSKITDVRLQFSKVPLEVPMQNIGGSTWRAVFTPRQLEMLAVSGKTVDYEAQVVAKNEDGQVAMAREPLKIAVNAPDLAKRSG